MKITIEGDKGDTTTYEHVREFLLLGLRMESPMNPQHFQTWHGSLGYLVGQLRTAEELLRKEDRHASVS
jgi:hypothetical protein